MKLVFLSSSDIHGYILPTDYQNQHDTDAPIGLARVSAIFKAEQARYGKENVILTDAGDYLQGSPLASYVHSVKNYRALSKYVAFDQAIGYDARCLGNHDFNYGLDYLKYFLSHNSSPIVNSNILDQTTNQPAFGNDYLIIEKNGLKIGLIGLTTQKVPSWEPAAHVVGLRFASAYEQASYYAQLLRPQVDILAVLYHGGFEKDPESGQITEPATGENEGYQILTQIPEIDIMLTGHQHRRMSLVAHDTAIVQPGYRGEAVGKVVLEIDEQTRKIKTKTASLIDAKDFAPDPEIIKLAATLNKETQIWLDQPVAELAQPAPINNAEQARIKGAPFVNLLQQMQLYFTHADVSATAVMSDTAKGFGKSVTMRDILLNYPYANQLCKVKLTGQELREIIEYSLSFLTKDAKGQVTFLPAKRDQLFNFDIFYPINYQADIKKKPGHRLTKLELNGQPIEDRKTYYLAVNNYRAMGGGFYPGYAPEKITSILAKDYVQMFQEFLTKAKPQVDCKPNFLLQ